MEIHSGNVFAIGGRLLAPARRVHASLMALLAGRAQEERYGSVRLVGCPLKALPPPEGAEVIRSLLCSSLPPLAILVPSSRCDVPPDSRLPGCCSAVRGGVHPGPQSVAAVHLCESPVCAFSFRFEICMVGACWGQVGLRKIGNWLGIDSGADDGAGSTGSRPHPTFLGRVRPTVSSPPPDFGAPIRASPSDPRRASRESAPNMCSTSTSAVGRTWSSLRSLCARREAPQSADATVTRPESAPPTRALG